MPIDRAIFFAEVRRSGVAGTPLKQKSVESLEAILDEFEKHYPRAPLPQISYGMATARHEAWSRDGEIDYEIEEYGGHLQGYGASGFYGRGLGQITHENNYRKLGEFFGVNLVANPKLALRKDISAGGLVIGSMLGWFRGDRHGRHSLPRYFPDGGPNDPIGAREIINGDKKKNGALIAGHYRQFLDALQKAQRGSVGPVIAKPAPRPPLTPTSVPAPPVAEKGFWGRMADRMRRAFPPA